MTIRKRIEAIVEWASALDTLRYDNPLRADRERMLWQMIENLDKEAIESLSPGRHLKWNVADGYAHYIVVKVNKMFTELVYIPYMDNYQFSGVFVDERDRLMVPTQVALMNAERSIAFRELFSKKGS